MKGYSKILVAVELISKTDNEILKHAEIMAKEFKADVTLVHAVENIGSYSAYGIGVGFEIEKILMENADKEMKELGEKLNIPEGKQVVIIGPAKYVILEEAEKMNADLIVVGSHSKHGLRTILGSTADGVLHGAKCDVLAVRLKS
ncbi:MAG: universal stress protein [Gammaproteobacteria bacterium]|nr:universal stress protein [Gammaproteobacteria bacterium]